MMKKIAVFIVAFFICLTAGGLADEETKADEALKLLRQGNNRFVEAQLQHPHESAGRREETAIKGQKPFAIVLACSDSRVPVVTIFDSGIGDIFVVRVAGNIAMDSSVIGSVEYAVEHLHSPLLVILGHTQCGAVEAAISASRAHGKIRNIQNKIRPVVARTRHEYPKAEGPDLLNAVIKNNALQAKSDLLSKSHEIKKMAERGELKIVTALYDIKSGRVEWFE